VVELRIGEKKKKNLHSYESENHINSINHIPSSCQLNDYRVLRAAIEVGIGGEDQQAIDAAT
jgi:hypothetical protein